MTASATARRSTTEPVSRSERRRARREASADLPVPPLSPRLQLVRGVLVLMFALSLGLLLEITVVSSLQRSAAQGRMFDDFREELANGTAPIGPTDADGASLDLGTPVAFIEIPALGLTQVIAEGTTSSVLLDGAGHRRDTPLPGQVGTSVVLGRRAAFGGPFGDIGRLAKGDVIRVTTSQGAFTFAVIGVRPEGAPVPAPVAKGGARLVLVTAAGRPYMPNGVLRVDADLQGDATGGPPRGFTAASLPLNERNMAGDTSTLWALALWLQALLLLAVVMIWAWNRWGRAQAWVVFLPPLVLVSLCVAGEVVRLLPNLL